MSTLLQEGGGQPPHGSLSWAIDNSFGSLEKLIAKMNAEGAAVQGSGWVVCTFISFAPRSRLRILIYIYSLFFTFKF